MKTIILLLIGVVGFTSLLFAEPQAVDAKSDPLLVTATAASAAREVPRWQSSLDDIRATAGVPLETNRKLVSERAALEREFDALNQQIRAQQEQNQELKAGIEQKRFNGDEPADVVSAKDELAQTDKAVLQKTRELATLKFRIQTSKDRLALRLLKLQEMEIDKKTIELDRKAKGYGETGGIKDEIAGLKEKLESLKGQEQYVRERMADDGGQAGAGGSERVRQARQERDALQSALAKLDQEKNDLSKKLADAEAEQGKSVSGNDVKKFMALTDEKNALDARISDLNAKKVALKTKAEQGGEKAQDIVAAGKALEKSNAAMENEISDIRENVAVLEYKINSIQRYNDRNKPEK